MVGARSALVRLVVMLTDHRVQHQQQQHSTAAATSSPPATTPAAAVAASGAVAANCRSPRTHRCKHCRVRLRNVHGRGDTRYVSSEAASVRAAPAAAAVAQLLNPLLIRSGFRAERLTRQWRGRLPMACGSWMTWSHCGPLRLLLGCNHTSQLWSSIDSRSASRRSDSAGSTGGSRASPERTCSGQHDAPLHLGCLAG